MNAAIPAPVQAVIETHIGLLHEALPGFLEGLYLQGSLALSAFTPGLSDVDFVAVTSRRATANDVAVLEVVHREVMRRFPTPLLEGSYLQWADLGRLQDAMPPHPHIHDGVLHSSGYHDISQVTWWIVKHRGIVLRGPPVEQLGITVDLSAMLAEVRQNMNTYWRRFTTHPPRIVWLLTDYGIQWTVLGVLRQYYTLREHAITSKVEAGRYGLSTLPDRWHALIDEAISIREGSRSSGYRSRIARALAHLRRLRWTDGVGSGKVGTCTGKAHRVSTVGIPPLALVAHPRLTTPAVATADVNRSTQLHIPEGSRSARRPRSEHCW